MNLLPLQGKEALAKFLKVSSFGEKLWVKASWDLPINLKPQWWRTRTDESGEVVAINYVFQLKGDSLTQFRWGGRDKDSTTIWQPETIRVDGFDYLYNLSQLGATIYFYPNNPSEGISNKHVEQTNLLFYEIDHLTLQQQWQSVERFTRSGLQPTAIVFTGGKSLHVYFRLSKAIKVEDWLRLNRKLAIVADGDPAICNAARAMRLPGMVRRKANDGKLTEPTSVSLEQWSETAYCPEDFEQTLDSFELFPYGLSDERWRQWRNAALKARRGENTNPAEVLLKAEAFLNPKPSYTHAPTAAPADPNIEFPLSTCLTRDDRELIANGIPHGSRDDTGYKLAANLVATARRLTELQYRFSGSPEQLFDEYCSRCNPPLSTGDRNRIWRQAEKSTSKPSLDDTCLTNCIRAWQAQIELPRQQSQQQGSQSAALKKEPEATQKKPRLNFDCTKEKNSVIEEKIRTVQRQLRSLSYKTDILLNQRYLPNDLPYNLPKSGLIGLVAPKGSGKSVFLKRIIQLAKEQGITILSITPRIALGREQAVKWEITWIDDYGAMQNRAEDTASHIAKLAEKRQQAKDRLKELNKPQQLTILDESLLDKIEQEKSALRVEIEAYGQQIENVNLASFNTLGLCWDSIWRTENRNMENALIIIDEAELGIKHFVTGSTCRRNRPHLLKVFADKIKDCLMSGGRVILSDADLTDLPVDYIRQLLPVPLNPFIVKNEYIGDETRWIVDFRTGSRGNSLDEILENIEMGYHLAITADSQAEAVALEEKILSKFPNFCAFIDSNKEVTQEALARKKPLVVRLDSKTAETEAGKNFIQKSNESILDWKPRVVIYTPTLGVGVSIDETTQRMDEEWQEPVPYFDFVYGLFFGVIEPSQCRQQLARVRANVPRIVWCKDSNKNLEGCPSFFPNEIKRQTLKYSHEALSIIDLAKGIAGYEADDEAIREAMIKLLYEAWDAESKCWKDPSLDLYAALKARENYSLWNLANVLREELQDEGHTVISIEGIKTDIVGEINQRKDNQKMQEATLIAQSAPMPLEEAQKISSKLGATDEQKRSAQKTLLQEELPDVNLTSEFIYKSVVKDRRRWLNRHKLFWYYSNFEAVKSLDTDHWLRNLRKFVQGKAIMSDIRSFSPKAKAIRESGVLDFISLQDTEKIYQGDTQDAQKFLKQALKAKDLLQTALNIIVTPKSKPIAVANRIISKVGLSLNKVTRSKKDNRYKLVLDLVNDPDRLAVLTALELRWQKSLGIQSQQATEVGGEVPVSLNENLSSPPSFQGQSQGACVTSTNALSPTNLENLQHETSPICNSQKSLETQSQQATEVGGEVPVSLNKNPSSPPNIHEISRVVVSHNVLSDLLQPSTPLEPKVELRAGMQIRVNIQKSSDPKVREVRAKSHGVAGTIQVTGPDDLYTILCEDGQLRYFKADVLEVVDENLSSPPIEEVSKVADGGKRSDRGGLKVGDRVIFKNPDKLEESKVYEGVCMKINRLIEGLLAFCQLPDGSEKTFGIATLEIVT